MAMLHIHSSIHRYYRWWWWFIKRPLHSFLQHFICKNKYFIRQNSPWLPIIVSKWIARFLIWLTYQMACSLVFNERKTKLFFLDIVTYSLRKCFFFLLKSKGFALWKEIIINAKAVLHGHSLYVYFYRNNSMRCYCCSCCNCRQ